MAVVHSLLILVKEILTVASVLAILMKTLLDDSQNPTCACSLLTSPSCNSRQCRCTFSIAQTEDLVHSSGSHKQIVCKLSPFHQQLVLRAGITKSTRELIARITDDYTLHWFWTLTVGIGALPQRTWSFRLTIVATTRS
ncbi:Uncharacterized protein HZ326_6990 [Fusarium oxysporum f. sp. albedinis]|nr:Uncharacterized protein HZ326_6990 [Fusarium oxysporum f. sp. albedinis]